MFNSKLTYWNSKGKYQCVADQLQALVPAEGSVNEPRKNPKLELFRKAVNCYYDLYNNGLCNRARQFASVFGIASGQFRYSNWKFTSVLYDLTEHAMNRIIKEAAEEQGIELSTQMSLF